MPDGSSFSDYLRFLLNLRRGRRATFLRYTIYLYLGSVFGFGGLYFALYRRNPATFAFTADILSAQATTFKLAARRDSITAELQIGLLQSLEDSMQQRPGSTPLPSHLSPGGLEVVVRLGDREYAISRSVPDSGLGAVETPGAIEVRREGFGVLAHLDLPTGKLDVLPQTASELHEQARGLVGFLRDQQSRSHDLVLRLPSLVRPSWGYADFIYFSAITQLTVGYGDILPNTTLVRVLVVLQSLVAVVMLVVVINLVITGQPAPAPKPPAAHET